MIPFKCDTGLCAGMPYIDIREHTQGLVMIKTVCKNMTGFTPQEIKKAVWMNKKGIANLISILMLKASRYTVSTHTKGEWKVVSPKGNTIPFKRDTGLCAGIP